MSALCSFGCGFATIKRVILVKRRLITIFVAEKVLSYAIHSTPFHKSQSEGRSKYREFAEFSYRICITPELVSQLLAMGDKVEVLEPEELRKDIKKKKIQYV